jgi:hypothetical protein
MLNSVPESMRACLIEAAKLAGPAFKRKAADCGAAPGSSGPGPLSFSITVDASGRGAAAAPPPAAGPAMAAFAAAAAGIPAAPPGVLGVAESDPLISALPGGNIGSNPLLGPLPSLAGVPSARTAPMPAAEAVAAGGSRLPAAAAAGAQHGGSGDQQELLELIRCGLLGGGACGVPPAASFCDIPSRPHPPPLTPGRAAALTAALCSREQSQR